jgi:hypothetical protein
MDLVKPPLCLMPALVLTLAGSHAAGAPFAGCVNHRLVGVGRWPSGTFDQRGPGMDTLGGVFSGMTFDSASWRRTGDAAAGFTYHGTLYTVADRGLGDGSCDYRPRLQTFSISIRPHYGPGPASQNQILFRNIATLLLTDQGKHFTGSDANDLAFQDYPRCSPDSPGHGRRCLDPEGLARTPDGGFFVSDEYGPFLYRFDRQGRLQYHWRPPAALLPRRGHYPNAILAFTSTNTPASGRRQNRGLEGLTLSPDGRRLVAMMQSPLVQDGAASDPGRGTRLLQFNLDTNAATFGRVVAEHVYQLTPHGGATNVPTAVSEVLAIGPALFLLLERDGHGLGSPTRSPPAYKRVVLATTAGASNLAQTGYDLEPGAPGQIALPPAGASPDLTSMPRLDFVDLLDTQQLARFGLNLGPSPDTNTLCEKWEGLALVPLRDPAAPDDYLLLVGNDNDFKAPIAYHNGRPVATNELTVDLMLLAYRVTLPGLTAAQNVK